MKAQTYEPSCPSIAALKSLSLVPHGDSGSCILFPYDEAIYSTAVSATRTPFGLQFVPLPGRR